MPPPAPGRASRIFAGLGCSGIRTDHDTFEHRLTRDRSAPRSRNRRDRLDRDCDGLDGDGRRRVNRLGLTVLDHRAFRTFYDLHWGDPLRNAFRLADLRNLFRRRDDSLSDRLIVRRAIHNVLHRLASDTRISRSLASAGSLAPFGICCMRAARITGLR